VIECKTDARQVSKYRQYVDEMDRATRLLLLLAGRLARLDNSLVATSAESPTITPVSSSLRRAPLMVGTGEGGRTLSDDAAIRPSVCPSVCLSHAVVPSSTTVHFGAVVTVEH